MNHLTAPTTLREAAGVGLWLCGVLASAAGPDYARDVQPIFAKHCYSCHGPDDQTSSYRLDVRDVALKGGDNGEAAIVPHKSAESPLIRHVANPDPALRMPPGDSDVPPLSAEQIATLKAWIDAGPAWPDEFAGSTDARASRPSGPCGR
ncbi:MAG: c-type cytochrome domain-containing protein, partial [Planctomycetaceae bacterium]